MQVGAFDRYVAGTSPVHHLDPRVKVGMTILFILSNAILPDGAWIAFGLSLGSVLAIGSVAGLGPGYTLRRSFVALPFAFAAVGVIFTLPGQSLAAVQLGPWRLVASDAGLVRFASIVLRSWLSVQVAILLTATTSFPDLLSALRSLRVPELLVTIIGLMYRYLAVLADEAVRLLRARESRSARLPGRGGGSLLWRARVVGNMVGQLFLRSYERSDRVYHAMAARGYRGRLLTLRHPTMGNRDRAAGAVACGIVLLLQLVGHLGRL